MSDPIEDPLEVPPALRAKFPHVDWDAVVQIPAALQPYLESKNEMERLQKENDTLRGLLGNSALPCTYCGLAAEDQAKCARGFPGCARADDQMLSKYFADGWAAEQYGKENLKLVGEIRKLRDALVHIQQELATECFEENDHYNVIKETQPIVDDALAKLDLTCLGLSEVLSIEGARQWFLDNPTGTCLGVLRERKTGAWHDSDLGDIVRMRELASYTEALIFFDLTHP